MVGAPRALPFFPLPRPRATFTDKAARKRPLRRREHLSVNLVAYVDKRLDAVRGKKFTDKMYGKLKKLVQRLIGKLHLSNLVSAIFCQVF